MAFWCFLSSRTDPLTDDFLVIKRFFMSKQLAANVVLSVFRVVSAACLCCTFKLKVLHDWDLEAHKH